MANKAGTVAPEERDSFVYCKGCGTPLESRARLSKPRAVVDTMMCESCREKHGHALMPAPGEPTYCYRCGTLEDVFVTTGISPATYHICPRCLPDRHARYSAGDFDSDLTSRQQAEADAKAEAENADVKPGSKAK
jgi:hypothetical protein